MSTRRWGWLLLVCSACTLDLVDVGESASEQTRMLLFVETVPEPEEALAVHGRLEPGRADEGGQRKVTRPLLDLMGHPQAPDSSLQEGRLVLEWHASVPDSGPGSPLLTLRLPDVAGLPTPEISPVELDRAEGWVGSPAAWERGSDLRLLHARAAGSGGVTDDAWSVRIRVLGPGTAHTLFRTSFATPVPDTIVLPAAWLKGLEVGDSLQVDVEREYPLDATPAGNYQVFGEVRQHLRWAVPVADPP